MKQVGFVFTPEISCSCQDDTAAQQAARAPVNLSTFSLLTARSHCRFHGGIPPLVKNVALI